MDWLDKIITPRVGVATVVESTDREYILLIKRKFPPLGWAFPGGFMNVGETIAQTATRELLEETGIVAEEVGLLDVSSAVILDPRAQFVVVTTVFKDIIGQTPKAGDDALEAVWVELRSELPDSFWDDLTARTKLEYKEYIRWRRFNDGKLKTFEWTLPRLK